MGELPSGWVECLHTPSSRAYFWHPPTGFTSWDAPGGAHDGLDVPEVQAAIFGMLQHGGGGVGGVGGVGGAVAAAGGGGGGGGPPLPAASEPFRRKRFLFLWHIRGAMASQPVTWLELRLPRHPPRAMLQGSIAALMRCAPGSAELRAKPRVCWAGEEGIDSGGLTKDWLVEVSAALRDAELGLFRQAADGSFEVDGRWLLGEDGEGGDDEGEGGGGGSGGGDALRMYEFTGRLAAKAIFERQLLDIPLSRHVVKAVLGLPPTLSDLQAVDPEHSSGLRWILRTKIAAPADADAASAANAAVNAAASIATDSEEDATVDVEGIGGDGNCGGGGDDDEGFELEQTFEVVVERLGGRRTVELCAGGTARPVTEENKLEYVRQVVRHRLGVRGFECGRALRALCRGFYSLIPREKVAIFDAAELALLLYGKPAVEVAEWRAGTVYAGFGADAAVLAGGVAAALGPAPPTPSEQQQQQQQQQHLLQQFGDELNSVVWFWRAVAGMEEAGRRQLLRFATGTTRIPLDGFDPPFTITKGSEAEEVRGADGGASRLPTAHTCFNQLVLPCGYASEAVLREKLMLAVGSGGGFYLT